MELNKAIEIVSLLARGINAATGECFPSDSPYNHPEIVRALYTVIYRTPKPKKTPKERESENISKGLPRNAGLPWSEEARKMVATSFKEGATIDALATSQERTKTAIVAELVRQKIISVDEGQALLGGGRVWRELPSLPL